MFGFLKPVGLPEIKAKPEIKMPDVNAMHDMAAAVEEKIITQQVEDMKRSVIARTHGAVSRGLFRTHLPEHRHGTRSEALHRMRQWLREQGYEPSDRTHQYNCTCRAHLQWSWENKVQRLGSGKDARTVVTPRLMEA